MHYAHSFETSDKAGWQPLIQHLRQVSALAAARGGKFGAGRAAALAGLLHDLGKYSAEFQRYISGNGPSPDHSTAGAIEVGQLLSEHTANSDRIVADLLAYAIAGPSCGSGGPLNNDDILFNGEQLQDSSHIAKKCSVILVRPPVQLAPPVYLLKLENGDFSGPDLNASGEEFSRWYFLPGHDAISQRRVNDDQTGISIDDSAEAGNVRISTIAFSASEMVDQHSTLPSQLASHGERNDFRRIDLAAEPTFGKKRFHDIAPRNCSRMLFQSTIMVDHEIMHRDAFGIFEISISPPPDLDQRCGRETLSERGAKGNVNAGLHKARRDQGPIGRIGRLGLKTLLDRSEDRVPVAWT